VATAGASGSASRASTCRSAPRAALAAGSGFGLVCCDELARRFRFFATCCPTSELFFAVPIARARPHVRPASADRENEAYSMHRARDQMNRQDGDTSIAVRCVVDRPGLGLEDDAFPADGALGIGELVNQELFLRSRTAAIEGSSPRRDAAGAAESQPHLAPARGLRRGQHRDDRQAGGAPRGQLESIARPPRWSSCWTHARSMSMTLRAIWVNSQSRSSGPVGRVIAAITPRCCCAATVQGF